ncbi:hypothetical protein GCM10027028_35600 [Streptomyces sundarbansensis]
MQQPVADLLRLGSREFAVPEQDAGPGQQIDRCETEFEPDGIDAEVSRGEAAESGGIASPDVVLDGGMPTVTDPEELGGASAGVGGVGEEHPMP